MRSFLTLFLILLFPLISIANDFEEKEIYRLNKTIYDLVCNKDNQSGFIASKRLKFVVVDKGNPEHYVVRFLYPYFNLKARKNSTVSYDDEYLLPKKVGNVEITKSTTQYTSGPVSGPLIVPFKYRLNDETISGEAALGLYAGYRFEFRIFFTDFIVKFTPFVAGGISQISVEEDGETNSTSGFTWATGLLIDNWDNVNIGIVWGEDRIGDKDWEYEGEKWLSFMVGWSF